jgi:hypothetical protein
VLHKGAYLTYRPRRVLDQRREGALREGAAS